VPLKACLDCGTPSRASRCPAHLRQAERIKRAKRGRTPAERSRRAETVRRWREQHGDVCPGWQVPAHISPDLTADHVTPVAAGGLESGPLTVLCRSCNSRKQDTRPGGGPQ
jgi:5-methylcytosine-specific restriction protein A